MIWLGIRINLKNCFYCIPTEKLSAIKNSIVLLIEKLPKTTAHELEKACEKLISTKYVLGDIVQLKTRNLYKVIENQLLWDSRVNLTNYEKAIKELIFWKNSYLAPPIYLIPRVIAHIKRSSSKGVLV